MPISMYKDSTCFNIKRLVIIIFLHSQMKKKFNEFKIIKSSTNNNGV